MASELTSLAIIGADTLVRDLGGDPDALAREAGLPPSSFGDHDTVVPLSATLRFFEIAAERLRCPDFGLRMAYRQDFSVLGSLYLMMLTAATVGEALELLARYLRLHSGGLMATAERVSAGMVMSYSFTFTSQSDDRQGIQLGLGLLVNFIRTRTRADWHPLYAQFRHGPPPELALHQATFGPDMAFGQERNAICIDAAVCRTPVPPVGAQAHRVAVSMIRRREVFERGALRSRTEAAVRARLAYGQECAVETVAQALGTSVRSLQRALAETGTSFDAIRAGVRADLARKYLLQSSISLAEIADILGYAQPSAFTRAFQRWHGVSPLRYRKRGTQ